MRRTNIASIVALFAILVLTTGAANPNRPTADNNHTSTGGNMSYNEIINSMGKDWVANNARLAAEKQADLNRWKAGKQANPVTRVGDVAPAVWPYIEKYLSTPVIGQSLVHTKDTWSTSTTTPYKDPSGVEYFQWNGPRASNYTTAMKSKTPVDKKYRKCAHCGTAATLVALRYLGSKGSATVGDLPTDNGLAILMLGIGWMDGAPDTYPNGTVTWAIQECCDGSPGTEYDNNMGRAINVLNTRAPGINYVLQYKSGLTLDGFNDIVRFSIDNEHPLILSIQTQNWPPYNTTYSGGHILLIDGYSFNQETGELVYRINDVNDCAFSRTAGKYTLYPYQIFNAMNYVIW